MVIISEYFDTARKAGKKEYARLVSSGEIGYLPSLEGILKNSEIVSQVYLGLAEIPLKKVIGTYTHLRSMSFAHNFMPLLNDSEFYSKWDAVCKHHLKDGINDPIKVYEYLNWLYVVEGNKRVSVMKLFHAYSIQAHITRLVPRMDENNEDIVIYYEFLRFNQTTHIYSIWFTRRGSFDELLKLLETYEPDIGAGQSLFRDKYHYFESKIYEAFRRVYHEHKGGLLPISTGDAMLAYLRIYGIPTSMKFDEAELDRVMKSFIEELEYFDKEDRICINTTPEEPPKGGMFSALTNLVKPHKRWKIAFVYDDSVEKSAWTKGHDLGRRYLEQVFGDRISTSFVILPTDTLGDSTLGDGTMGDGYAKLKEIVNTEPDVIFVTSPALRQETLRCALEHQQIHFFQCAGQESYRHLNNYYGRTFEPIFLAGLMAGALTKTNIIGYAGTEPTPEVVGCVNAFALGAGMVNPKVRIKVAWTGSWGCQDYLEEINRKLVAHGADYLISRRYPIPEEVMEHYGVHSMLTAMNLATGEAICPIAMPIWNWGKLYERIVENLLNGAFDNTMGLYGSQQRLVNFWWGMETEVLGLYLMEQHIPVQTQKLIHTMSNLVSSLALRPFAGPIWDRDGELRVKKDEILASEDVLSMDWFVENVDIIENEREEKSCLTII